MNMRDADVRAWQCNVESRDIGYVECDRSHYIECDNQRWTGQDMNMNKPGYYPTYQTPSPDGSTYYPSHTHAVNRDMTSCDPSIYTNTQIVPMTAMASSHGMYDPQHNFPSSQSAGMDNWNLQVLSQPDPFSALPFRDGRAKRKRRRVISLDQRKAANIRERRRMYQMNDAFDGLRKRVPTFAYEKKLSRMETLKLAVNYIEFMAEILKNNGEKCKELVLISKSKKNDHVRSQVSDDDSLSSVDDDVTSGTLSPDQSAGAEISCDVPDNNLNNTCLIEK